MSVLGGVHCRVSVNPTIHFFAERQPHTDHKAEQGTFELVKAFYLVMA